MGKKHQLQSYRVKDILEYKVQKGQEYFLVWWYGYPKKEATWEPKVNVQDLYDFDTYYQKLKQTYQEKNIPNPPKEESNQESSLKEQSSKLSKSKKISKLKKLQEHNNQSHSVQKIPQQPPIVNYLVEQPKQVLPQPPKQVIELLGVDPREQEYIKKKLQECPPIKFEIKIQQFKELPFIGQKIKRINQSFMRGSKMMYEVELQSKAMIQPIILSQNYLRVLWPREFAEYLLSKIKP